jgi:UTP--glucose-1-phosphate uridylyltransferase
VNKAIIPAAGYGTRMLPATKAIPKEMLPVLDRPAIQHVVEEAADAGVDEVLLITSRHKRAIENHFDGDGELEAHLKRSGQLDLLASIHSLAAKVKVHSVRQAQMRGLGDAILHSRKFAGNQPFLCMLGDAIFAGAQRPAAQLTAAFERLGTPIIGLEEVPVEKVDRYGIVGGTEVNPGVWRIEKVVEKPNRANAPSRLAIAARYVLTPAIFDCLDQVSPGAGGEIQLSDALAVLVKREPVHGILLSARRHDIGDLSDWLTANLHFAAADKKLWDRIEPTLRALTER